MRALADRVCFIVASYHSVVVDVEDFLPFATSVCNSTPSRSVVDEVKWPVIVTFVAESHAAPRKARSPTTSMAWLRLRAVVTVGTLIEMSDGFWKDVDVIDAPETLSAATEVDFVADRMSEGEASGFPLS